MKKRAWLRILLLCVAVGCQALVPLASPASARTPALARRQPARPNPYVQELPEPDLRPPARTAPLHQAPPLDARLSGIIRRVALPAGDRRIALTFDLCERSTHVTGFDAPLADALDARRAKATFFAGGKWLRSHPEAARRLMANPRFELGNHAWTHANMRSIPPQRRAEQALWTSAQAELLREDLDARRAKAGLPPTGPRPLTLFRLPYGRGDAETAQSLNRLGLAVIQWDVVGEGGHGSAKDRARAIAEAARPGAIVLLHANRVPKDTALVVRLLLPLLEKKGLATATVGELLAAGAPEAVSEGYFSIPGDNERYDQDFEDDGTGRRARRN